MDKNRTTMAKKRYSFRKAYESVPFNMMKDVRSSLLKAMGIGSLVTFCVYKNKGVSPSKDVYDRVEEVFSSYGIDNCWEEIDPYNGR